MRKSTEKVSAIILAGGISSRMGMNKAELMWNGSTLIEHQVGKVRRLGIDDIIVSGYPKPIHGTRFVADKYPLKGPLGGIHAGLGVAAHAHCLVLSVDAPLVPVGVLEKLIDAHIEHANSITILSHGDKTEPLIGVYEARLSDIADSILRSNNTSVRVLFEKAGVDTFEYLGNDSLLFNCNTPSEYSMLLAKQCI